MHSRLMNLYLMNRGNPARRPLQCLLNEKKDEATVYVYDVIVSDEMTAEWWGGVAPGPFAKELAKLNVSTVHLRINSPGGDVFAARAMAQAIKEHDAQVIAHVDGYAASAASILAVEADDMEMAEGSLLMIHKAWTMAMGNSDDMIDTAALLEKVDTSLAETYAKRSGQDIGIIKQWMADETWFTPAEALDAGFIANVKGIAGVQGFMGASVLSWNLSAYAHAPRIEQRAPAPAPAPAPEPAPLYIEAHNEHLRRRLRLQIGT